MKRGNVFVFSNTIQKSSILKSHINNYHASTNFKSSCYKDIKYWQQKYKKKRKKRKKKGTNKHQCFLIFNFIITIIVDPARCQIKSNRIKSRSQSVIVWKLDFWDTDFDSSEVRLSSVTKMGRDGILCNEKMPKTRNNNSGFTQGISRFFYSMPQPNQSACGWMWLGFYFLFIFYLISTFLPWDHVKLFRIHPHGGGFHL